MKITAWRIFKASHARHAFSGIGAKIYGGRWNSRGTAMVYAAGSISLAALEMLVHLRSRDILRAYRVCDVAFDEKCVTVVKPSQLPRNWRGNPAPSALQRIGDEWIAAGASAVLRVPSAIITSESNFLLNPNHADFRSFIFGTPGTFEFDPRLT